MWLLMVGKTKPASVIYHQRERSPEVLEDGPPMRSLIRIRLPSTEEDGVHRDEKVTTVKCLPNLPSKQKFKSIILAGRGLSGCIQPRTCSCNTQATSTQFIKHGVFSFLLRIQLSFPNTQPLALHHFYSFSQPRVSMWLKQTSIPPLQSTNSVAIIASIQSSAGFYRWTEAQSDNWVNCGHRASKW